MKTLLETDGVVFLTLRVPIGLCRSGDRSVIRGDADIPFGSDVRANGRWFLAKTLSVGVISDPDEERIDHLVHMDSASMDIAYGSGQSVALGTPAQYAPLSSAGKAFPFPFFPEPSTTLHVKSTAFTTSIDCMATLVLCFGGGFYEFVETGAAR